MPEIPNVRGVFAMAAFLHVPRESSPGSWRWNARVLLSYSSRRSETIVEKRLRFVFCGHIHTGRNRRASGAATHRDAAKPSEASAEHRGVDFESTRVYNLSRLDERYEIAYEPTWMEI